MKIIIIERVKRSLSYIGVEYSKRVNGMVCFRLVMRRLGFTVFQASHRSPNVIVSLEHLDLSVFYNNVCSFWKKLLFPSEMVKTKALFDVLIIRFELFLCDADALCMYLITPTVGFEEWRRHFALTCKDLRIVSRMEYIYIYVHRQLFYYALNPYWIPNLDWLRHENLSFPIFW